MAIKKNIPSSLILPKAERLEVKPNFRKLIIGIPKESSFQENRTSLTPDSVGLLVNNGHNIIIEKGSGVPANFTDEEYLKAGASIVNSKEEVYKADFILKIEPPTASELKLMSNQQNLISAFQINTQNASFLTELTKKNISALAFEFIKDEQGKIPIVRSMSEIAGTTSILIASEYLNNANEGKGLLLGGISGIVPAQVVILGAGTVAEYATRTAIGLGASVIVFDNSVTKLRRIQNNNNQRVSTSTIQPKVLLKSLMRSDVVISALRIGHDRIPCIVNENIVRQMKPGSVIVDVSIDQGGCFETSEVTNHKKPTYIKHDIIHYCVPNIASRVSRTASMAISNILTPLLISIGDEGGLENLIKNNHGLRDGVYAFQGMVTNKILSNKFNLPYKDLDLIMATR